MEIEKDGELLHEEYRETAQFLEIGVHGSKKTTAIGRDLTGNGEPDLAIYERTQGWHCCKYVDIYEIGNKFRHITRTNWGNYCAKYKDLDGDSIPEAITRDSEYEYWPGCYAYSPNPQVILRWKDDGYVVAADLMRSPPPSHEELEALAASIRKDSGWGKEYYQYYIPYKLFSEALHLMYTGNEELGWEFIRMAWKPEFSFDYNLIEDLRGRMSRSDYWPQLEAQ